MIPVFQTKLHGNGVRGNCMRASLASIFELGIDEIPCFEMMQKGEWKPAFKQWLHDKGFKLIECQKNNANPLPNEYYISLGLTRRGVFHCVVSKKGEMIHDPHPSQEGLLEVVRTWVFAPL